MQPSEIWYTEVTKISVFLVILSYNLEILSVLNQITFGKFIKRLHLFHNVDYGFIIVSFSEC